MFSLTVWLEWPELFLDGTFIVPTPCTPANVRSNPRRCPGHCVPLNPYVDFPIARTDRQFPLKPIMTNNYISTTIRLIMGTVWKSTASVVTVRNGLDLKFDLESQCERVRYEAIALLAFIREECSGFHILNWTSMNFELWRANSHNWFINTCLLNLSTNFEFIKIIIRTYETWWRCL